MAPPNLIGSSMYLSETNSAEPVQIIGKPLETTIPQIRPKHKSAKPQYRWQVVWRNVLIFIYLHIAGFYGVYYYATTSQWRTNVFVYFVAFYASLGVTVGAHRLWAHRCYKAKLPLRIMLMIAQTMALQNHIYEWVRDHRVHHKFTDTDADPHNSSRGFFFSHMGWLLVKKHKDVILKGKTVDLSDVKNDPVCEFQRKYYLILAPLFCFLLPALIPWYFWNENLNVAWNIAIGRYVLTLHGTWLVNSAAHMWGSKPFDKNINASDNRAVAFIAFGEGWHNYHHVFPWDYKAAELPYHLNFSTLVIDFMSKIGWAYDLKTVHSDMIMKRAVRTGDGTRKIIDLNNNEEQLDEHHHEDSVWGWDDKDLTDAEKEMAQIHNPENQ